MPRNVLIVAEHKDGDLRKVTFEMLGEGTRIAEKLGGVVDAALLGSGVGGAVRPAHCGVADALAHYGAVRVYLADAPSLGKYSGERYTTVLASLIEKVEPAVVLLGATTQGKDLAPQVAARLGLGLASDCTAFEVTADGRLIITRPIYGGRAIATVMEKTTPQMATVRPNVMAPLEPDTSRTAPVEKLAVETGDIRAKVIDLIQESDRQQVGLAEADIIVSGGRGLKGPENFCLLEELAEILGAAVGASRAAVDAGWIDHSHQVGQTGRTVTPDLYIACGISGAVQHLAGMKTARYIAAINKDPDAPIFRVADYGIVGDLFEVVPILTEEFKKVLQQKQRSN
jgi:electron transfer flavoprotein alpha subunit